MAHLLIIELPGGNDTDIVDAAIAGGHACTFLSADLAHYRRQPAVWAALGQARACIDIPGFAAAEVERRVRELHAQRRIDAVLCLIDIRLVEAARLARMLGLRHLNPDSAELLRDKVGVRRRLAACGIAQPAFDLATTNAGVAAAVRRIGLPVLIKPADGYGSQNIVVLRDEHDLDPLMTPLDDLLPSRTDYGLGVRANDRLLVERYMAGRFIGVDTLTVAGRHTVLGVHDKRMFEPPSFAIRGSTFVPASLAQPVPPAIRDYAHAALDAVGYDWGAAHLEIMLTDDGPQLVEINARLVGARIARLASLARGRSLHADLIAVHLGAAAPLPPPEAQAPGVIRWIVAERCGRLEAVQLPRRTDARIRDVAILRQPGDAVGPPFENADRIGYVMVCGDDRQQAEQLADRFVAATTLVLQAEAPAAAPAMEAAC